MCKAALLKIRYLLALSFSHSPLSSFLSRSSFLLPSSFPPSSVCLSFSIFILPVRAFRFERFAEEERGYQNAECALDRSSDDDRSPSITVASLTLHYEITSLGRSLPTRIVLDDVMFPANPSLSLSLSSSSSFHATRSFLPMCERNVARSFPLHSLHRRRRRTSVNPPSHQATLLATPRHSWRSRAVR